MTETTAPRIDREEAAWLWYEQQNANYPIDEPTLARIKTWLSQNPDKMAEVVKKVGPIKKWNWRALKR